MATDHLDVLIVGAGLSGIAAAYYIQTRCPNKSYAILEGREALGGTWDLFRYPGVRSDSDMHTLGYAFRPWPNAKAIADGPAILTYIRETAQIYGIDKNIRFGHILRKASWSSAEARWTIEIERGPNKDPVRLTCNFLYMCTGYYDYDQGYMPIWPGVEQFKGQIIHPQTWPETLDYAGKRVVVIGSGATAVTLVPAMAETAAHVTMLQRSPTYVVSSPTQDAIGNRLHRILPDGPARWLVRWKNILMGIVTYNLARKRPAAMKKLIVDGVREQLGPDYDVEKHFTPTYNPWDQRICLVPDADLFTAIKSGRASVVTDQIENFTPTGICLRSGEELEADIIVTATGLVMSILKGVEAVVDGVPVQLPQTMSYKGMMFSDIPNLAAAIGYTNASWTLKCELTAEYIARLLNYMEAHNYVQCTPRQTDPSVEAEPIVNFTSGYVQRALDNLPHQGSKRPWKMYQNYLLDMMTMRYGAIRDGVLEFKQAGEGL